MTETVHAHHGKHSMKDRLFEYRSAERKKLILSLSLTSAVMIVEIIGGLITNSLALISDAGHMFTHAFAIVISLVAIAIAKKPLCHHRTFGLYRAEILAAFVNGLFLLTVAGIIAYEAVLRFIHVKEVSGMQMMIIAGIGLATNVASVLILRGSRREDLNVRSVFFHMIADAASSVGIIAASIIILFTRWYFLDPLVSLVIAGLIVAWAWGILRESGIILLEMAPTGINLDMVSEDLMKAFPEITRIENDHLWAITADMLVYSAHVEVKKNAGMEWNENRVDRFSEYLCTHYGFVEITLQITSKG